MPAINRILCADAYTLASFDLVSAEMRDQSAYHIVFRKCEVPRGIEDIGVGKIVFHGLTRILRQLFETPLAAHEVDEARRFLATLHLGGKPFPADFAMWDQIVRLGYFPLRIYARRDGSTVNAGEPVVQVIGDPGFGELAGHFESKLLQVWAPSARATHLRRWLEYNEGLVRKTTDLVDAADIRALAQTQLSDFGDRASSCSEESEVLGMAHLTCFHGTDTLAGAYAAWKASGGKATGSSVRALAHRVVQGHPEEIDSFKRLMKVAGPGGIGSYVADCYDYPHAVRELLVPMAREAALEGSTIVARPDSGDALEAVRVVLDAARDAGLCRTNGKGLIEMTSLRYIYADHLDFARIRHDLNKALIAAGYSPPGCGIYGMGGMLRNNISRDAMGAVMKVCSVGASHRPVAKFAPGGKGSIPGLVAIRPNGSGDPTVFPADSSSDDFGALELLYDRGHFTRAFDEDVDFATVRARVLRDYDTFIPSRQVLSPAVRATLEKLAAHHVRRVV